MGGEGSMLHAIRSLEYNNSLKRKNNPFKKEWGVGGAWYQDYTKYTDTEPHNSHYDKDARAKVRRKVRLERKRDQSGLVTVGVLVIVLTALAVYLLINARAVIPPARYQPPVEAETTERADQYQYFINAGDDWLAQNQWANAAFEYQKALEFYPGDFDAHARLATAYTYSCKHEQKNCEAAELLIERLLSQKPQSAELYFLRASCHLAQGDDGAAARDFAMADGLQVQKE